MKLIDDWKQSHRLYTQRINGVMVAIGGAYMTFYDALRDLLPARYVVALTVVLAAMNCVARIIKQEPKHGRQSQD